MAANIQSAQLTALAELHKQIGPKFRSAAPEGLVFAQEKAFFEQQLMAHHQIRHAIMNGVEATIESAKQHFLACASMGLSMNPSRKLVYAIPRRARKRYKDEANSTYEKTVPWLITTHPSYMGLAFIATNYGGAADVVSEVVFAADEFELYTPLQLPKHKRTTDNALRNADQAIGVYAMIKGKDGGLRVEYIDRPTVLKIRAMSDFPNSVMWVDLWTEGWRKAAVRRICKLGMQTCERMSAALNELDHYEGTTFDNEGNVVSVPRGTSRDPNDDPGAPQLTDETKGLAGVTAAMRRAQDELMRPQTPELVLAGTGPLEQERTEHPREIPQPAASNHPEGSIEWWADQIHAATDRDRLDRIKAAALARGVPDSDIAEEFKQIYIGKSRELRGVAP